MDAVNLLVLLAGVVYMGAIIYVANQEAAARGTGHERAPHSFAEAERLVLGGEAAAEIDDAWRARPVPAEARRPKRSILTWMLYSIVALMVLLALTVLQAAVVDFADVPDAETLTEVNAAAAAGNALLAALGAVLSVGVIRSAALRRRLRQMLTPGRAYDPDSPVHTAAIVLSVVVLSTTLSTFVLSGGLTGLAQDIAVSGITADSVVLQTVLEVAVAFLGVGLLIRRDLRQSLARLGLQKLTPDDVKWGIVVGFALFVAVIIIAGIWAALVSPEVFEEQTAASDEIAREFDTLPLAFLLAGSAAVGEEVLFRGALQPVFGVLPVALFFTLLHTQYSFTPATLIILVAALGLGWLRDRRGTSTAIVAHFVFNFVQLALSILLASPPGG